MTTKNSATIPSGWVGRLRSAGIEQGDSEEMRLNRSLLMLATGMVCVSMMVWVALYWFLGLSFSIDIPMAFMLLLTGNMFLYIWIRRFDFFRVTQLALFLFLPFVAQWVSGNLITSSGVVIWGLLAPVGAILCIGARQSLGWFIAWVVLMAVSGAADYYLADALLLQKPAVSTRISLLFFTLNFVSVAAISYALLLYSIEQKRRAQERLEKARQQLQVAMDAAEKLVTGPVIFI